MKLVALTTVIPEIQYDGLGTEHVQHAITVAGKEHTDLSAEVYEGEGTLAFTFANGVKEYYIEEVRYLDPANANDDEVLGGEEADPNLLYSCTTEEEIRAALAAGKVVVPVTVDPGMKQLYVKVAKASGDITGVSTIDVRESTITRCGDVVYADAPGIECYDLAGRLVANTASSALDLSTLANGAYIVRAGKTTVKIVK